MEVRGGGPRSALFSVRTSRGFGYVAVETATHKPSEVARRTSATLSVNRRYESEDFKAKRDQNAGPISIFTFPFSNFIRKAGGRPKKQEKADPSPKGQISWG